MAATPNHPRRRNNAGLAGCLQAKAGVVRINALVKVLLAVVVQRPDDEEHDEQRNAGPARVDAERQASAVAWSKNITIKKATPEVGSASCQQACK